MYGPDPRVLVGVPLRYILRNNLAESHFLVATLHDRVSLECWAWTAYDLPPETQ
jgi:hypothetical protein